MFDNDKPVVAGFSANPPSTLYNAYLSGSSSTRDTAFLATRGSGTERNAAALRAWVAQSSSPIAINAHASFEGFRRPRPTALQKHAARTDYATLQIVSPS